MRLNQQFEKPEFIVDELIATGLGLICGKPKVGKSRFALKLCIDIAAGMNFLGKFPAKPCKVAYYALEDNASRIQDRLIDMGAENNLANILISNQLRAFDDGGLNEFTQLIRDNPDVKVWMLDTLQKIKPVVRNKSQNAYEDDYNFMGKLQAIAIDNNIALLLIHHSRKDTSSGDFIDSALGSTGLTAAVDMIIILDQDADDKGTIRLQMTGGDVERRTLKYKVDPVSMAFTVTEDDGGAVIKHNAHLQNQIMQFLEQNPGTSYGPTEVVNGLGKTETSARSSVSKALKKLLIRGMIVSSSSSKYQAKLTTGHTGHTGHGYAQHEEIPELDGVTTFCDHLNEVGTGTTSTVSGVTNGYGLRSLNERQILPIIQPTVSTVTANYTTDNNIIKGGL